MKKQLLLFFMMLLPMVVSADVVVIDGFYYNLIEKAGQAEVTHEPNYIIKYSGSVVIPEFVVYEGKTYSVISIDNGAFYKCSDLTSVTIPNSVTNIGNGAFYECSGLTSVTIPNSVTNIGIGAFSGCSGLSSITIPNSVRSIDNYAFDGCSGLTSVHITDIESWSNISFASFYSNPLSFAHYLYLNGEEVKDLVIPNSVTSIGDCAFSGCSGLISVTIPNSVTSIGYQAFEGCSGLTSVTIPNSVTSIGERAFMSCSGLTSVTISNSVTSIGENVFYKCSGLTSLTIPNSVTSISNYAFYYCSGLTSVTIPNSVTSIGKNAFDGCSGLTSVTIPNSVTSIDNQVFQNCSGLTSLTIPNSVTSIGNQAFQGCSGLTSVTIPNSVTFIGGYAFLGCNGLTSVTIGSGVNRIEYQAFVECKELKDVYCLAESVPNTDANVFIDSYIEYSTLHVPANSLNAYKTTAPWSGFGKIVRLDGSGTETKKCATPTISYQFGQLSFSCETEDVTFVSEITDYDIKKSYDASLYLTATYYISVYATKDGYENSDVATATLSWMDAELFTDDISGGAATVRAKAVLIQSNGSMLSIAGADEGTAISVYDMSGKMVGSATAASENTNISTSLRPGDIGFVKIGEKTIKIIIN